MRTAVREEDDPPQNPCEPCLSTTPPDYLKGLLHQVSSLFFASKSSGATIRLIRNYPYIIRQCPASLSLVECAAVVRFAGIGNCAATAMSPV